MIPDEKAAAMPGGREPRMRGDDPGIELNSDELDM